MIISVVGSAVSEKRRACSAAKHAPSHPISAPRGPSIVDRKGHRTRLKGLERRARPCEPSDASHAPPFRQLASAAASGPRLLLHPPPTNKQPESSGPRSPEGGRGGRSVGWVVVVAGGAGFGRVWTSKSIETAQPWPRGTLQPGMSGLGWTGWRPERTCMGPWELVGIHNHADVVVLLVAFC